MKNKKLIRILLLVLSLVAFFYYFFDNQQQFEKLADLSIPQISLVVAGQALIFLSNILFLILFINFTKNKVAFIDAVRVSAYSSMINFFGFLQGGLGFRGVYLKKYFNISYKRYFALTFMQYAMVFGIAGLLIISGLGIVSGTAGVLVFILAIVGALAFALFLFRLLKPRVIANAYLKLRNVSVVFQAKPIISLFLIALLQLSGSTLAYGVELSAVGAKISIGGLLTYTGISQFSILVALTPGAIGIREAMLLVAQNQMGLSSQDIILAATIDRLAYFAVLALLVPLAIAAKRQQPEPAN
ncbi:MAG: lysylphosphatidylglycerol synthase transmembrane domain-containing protein [Candidatus Saccharibacteria bacterium]|nr:lysylphosphatidylglycerol synthase transmembrane domain-containing protein [Candidatus Saccharibacteria bacterium]